MNLSTGVLRVLAAATLWLGACAPAPAAAPTSAPPPPTTAAAVPSPTPSVARSAGGAVPDSTPVAADADPGSLRGEFALAMPNNLVHGSDSPESAEREIGLWFTADELV